MRLAAQPSRREPASDAPSPLGLCPAVVVGIIISDVLGYEVDVLDQRSLEARMDSVDDHDAAGNATTVNSTLLYNRVLDTVSPGPTHQR